MIVHSHFHFSFFLDLPKLHTISFNGECALTGNNGLDYETAINDYASFDNTFIMKSKLKRNEM